MRRESGMEKDGIANMGPNVVDVYHVGVQAFVNILFHEKIVENAREHASAYIKYVVAYAKNVREPLFVFMKYSVICARNVEDQPFAYMKYSVVNVKSAKDLLFVGTKCIVIIVTRVIRLNILIIGARPAYQ
jgi:hypothetical protein